MSESELEKYYDQHLHTHFSYDSEENFEAYLTVWPGKVVTTEHFDLSNPVTEMDDVPDFAAYFAEIQRLNQIHGGRILAGVEIGYFAPREADTLQLLAGHDFDLKLLSVHHNGKFDYLDDFVADYDFDEIFTEYLELLTAAIGRVPAHVLAHFDYGVRLFDLPAERLKAYEPQLKALFQKMIAHDLAFEINAKSVILFKHKEAYAYAVKLVQELGGRKFTLGSDGHLLKHFRLEFDNLLPWLKSLGVNELVTFEKGQARFCAI